MTSKKRRQRGTRTHSSGSQKNRRGAGHRGGRGRAGRDKHEYHHYEPLGKSGFKRPEKAQTSVSEVKLREIDEDLPLLVESGVVTETDDGYRVDARELGDEEADVVKVLGGGQLHHTLSVTADAFTDGARDALEATGGDAIVPEDATDEPDESED
ncbi:uL15 family ribosomal protein [Halodesulfurarchaeum sp. HSR-GB]|uniref:uL15m family ribosomal protein n=1 Tax=Halodesulfurarchaeum sp. HSR-GB TaxID=3074077 RepID=UPI002864C246|nr:uL15 family ribosomal protein [Halodesulfurarchaeum sp. HSR-GB]MDR5655825.1 uL15 family ribosomal protein [Halodesulfurarchaeum sp. HSR-GB]